METTDDGLCAIDVVVKPHMVGDVTNERSISNAATKVIDTCIRRLGTGGKVTQFSK